MGGREGGKQGGREGRRERLSFSAIYGIFFRLATYKGIPNFRDGTGHIRKIRVPNFPDGGMVTEILTCLKSGITENLTCLKSGITSR